MVGDGRGVLGTRGALLFVSETEINDSFLTDKHINKLEKMVNELLKLHKDISN